MQTLQQVTKNKQTNKSQQKQIKTYQSVKLLAKMRAIQLVALYNFPSRGRLILPSGPKLLDMTRYGNGNNRRWGAQ